MKIPKEKLKEIRIEALEIAFENIKNSQIDSEWFRELTAIDNAIKWIKEN